MDFDAVMQRTFGMHQHLTEILFHTTRRVYVQCRKICEIHNCEYYYRCGVSFDQEEDVPTLAELKIV